jgi:DNA mismatch repair protein MutL
VTGLLVSQVMGAGIILEVSIQILSDEVASQIAAGEVIERPASVVKELLENALDAHAASVQVRIGNAGKSLIELSDDGDGIPSAELQLAVARHATSKLRNAEDLFHIITLGFRGEALASIGSISRLTLTSRNKNESIGGRLRVEGGQVISAEQAGVPVGTVVTVEDLFYNVPARLKFLKQDMTERRQVDALVTRYSMAYPHVRFQLFQDGRPALMTSGNSNRREVLVNLFGVDEARQMMEVQLDEDDIQISGFISPIALSRSHRRDIIFFVNGRSVQDPSLSSAMMQAYRNMLMVGRYPISILFIEIQPELVDVNVHPAKAEVRFREADRVFGSVQRAVRRGLLAYSPVPPVNPPGWGPSSWQPSFSAKTVDPSWSLGHTEPASTEPAAENYPQPGGLMANGSSDLNPQPSDATGALPGATGILPLLRLVGQVGNTYIVAEGPDGLYLIDQHAAHERVLFERFQSYRSSPVVSQTLLEPVTFQLQPHLARLLTDQLPLLTDLGFQVEPFGPSAFRVRAFPALLAKGDPVAAVRVVVEDFEEDETPLQSEIEAKLIARICKRVAVKGGQSLSVEEQRALLRDLESCVSPRTCPHGRPTMIHLSVDVLERQFGRRGSR